MRLLASFKRYPIPEEDATSSAATTAIHDALNPSLNPINTFGRAEGKYTLKNVSILFNL